MSILELPNAPEVTLLPSIQTSVLQDTWRTWPLTTATINASSSIVGKIRRIWSCYMMCSRRTIAIRVYSYITVCTGGATSSVYLYIRFRMLALS